MLYKKRTERTIIYGVLNAYDFPSLFISFIFSRYFSTEFLPKGVFSWKKFVDSGKDTFIRGSAAARRRGIKYLHMEGREAYISILNYYIL